MGKNLAIRRVGSVIVLRQNRETPTDEEWNAFLNELDASRSQPDAVKILIYTEGGAPSPSQRKRLESMLEPRAKMPVAVVCDDLRTRFIASTIALFHKHHRSFTTKELDAAFEHLSLSWNDRRAAEQALRELAESVP